MSKLIKAKDTKIIDIFCPVCHSAGAKVLYVYSYDDKSSDIVECSSCAHMWIDPIPLQEINLRNMDTVEDSELFNSKILTFLHRKIVVLPEIRHIERLKGKGRLKLLDIACGSGWALSIWQV